MRLRYKIGLAVAVLAGVFLWGRCSRQYEVSSRRGPNPAAVLPKNDAELITYNENRHIVTVTTTKGITQTYSRNPTVEIHKDGTVKVDNHMWGLEVRPFIGAGYSDTGRMYTGCQLFYFRQFDASAAFGWTADNRRPIFQPIFAIGWNFWSDTSLNLGVNPLTIAGLSKPEPAIFLSVRL